LLAEIFKVPDPWPICKILRDRTVNARRVVKVNERGLRIGEDHHNAKLTDAEVELLLVLRREGWGYRRLAAKFEVARNLVVLICKGKRRNQTCAGHKAVHVPG
jgi:hypothetical protein